MSMGAGEFNRRITLHEKSGAVDAANQPIDDFADAPAFTLWAKILGASGLSVVRAGMDGVAATSGMYSFRVRYRPTGIHTDMQLRYGGFKFDVRDVRHDFNRHEYTDIVCELGANDG